jgi:hypothetical protein
MEGISDIRIMGMDETRPPKIRKEPYIDLIFRLTHKAPSDWCQDFNDLLASHQYAPKIRREEGLYIEAWVRNIDEIDSQFQEIKQAITRCTREYIEKIQAIESKRDAGNDLQPTEGGPQARLNSIIAGLDFSDDALAAPHN